MSLILKIPLLLTFVFSLPAMAATLDLAVEAEAAGPVKFAMEEIRREAAAKGITFGDDASATRVLIRIDDDAKATPQSYRIRVKDKDGKRSLTVHGADPAGAMYGGLDLAEAIRIGTFDTLTDSENKPHIAQRGIKFNIPLDLRLPRRSPRSRERGRRTPKES